MAQRPAMSERDLYITLQRNEWNDMFPGGYIGDGVYVADMCGGFGDEYDAMTATERREAIRDLKRSQRLMRRGQGECDPYYF